MVCTNYNFNPWHSQTSVLGGAQLSIFFPFPSSAFPTFPLPIPFSRDTSPNILDGGRQWKYYYVLSDIADQYQSSSPNDSIYNDVFYSLLCSRELTIKKNFKFGSSEFSKISDFKITTQKIAPPSPFYKWGGQPPTLNSR